MYSEMLASQINKAAFVGCLSVSYYVASPKHISYTSVVNFVLFDVKDFVLFAGGGGAKFHST